jgi:DNA-binding CsgD family transcriptional regulator
MKEIGEMLGVSTTRISQFLAEAKIHYDAIESGEGQQLQKPLSQGVSIAKAQSIKVEDLVGVTDPKHLEMWELKAHGLSHQKIADKFEMTIAGVRSVLGMIWIRQGARALEFCKPAPTTVCRSVPTVVKNGKNHGKGRNFEIQQEAGKKYAELAKTTLTNALVVAVLSNFEKDILSLMLEEKSAAEIANVLNTEELKVSRFDVLHKIKRIKALPEIIEKGMVIAKTVMDNALVMSILDDFDKEVLAQMLSGKIILQIADNMGVIFAKVRGCYTRLNRLHLSLLAGTWTYCEGIVESEEDSQLQLPEQEEKNEERDDVVVKRNSFFEEVVKTDDYLQNEQALMEVLSAKHKEVWKLSIEGFVTREIGKIIGVSQARVSQLSVEAQVSYNAIAGGEDPQFKKMFGGVTLAEIRSVKADDLVEVVDLKHREMWRLRAEGVSLEKIGNKFEMTAGGISAILGKLWAKQGAEVVVESGRVLTPQQEIASKGYVELAKATLTNDLLVAALTDSEKSITNLMLEGKIAEEIAQELEMSRSNVNNGIRSIKNIPNLIEKNRTIAQFVLDNTRIASSLNDFDRDVLRLMSAGKLTLQIISDLDSTMGKVSGSFRKLKRIHEMMALRLASEVA